MFIPQSLVHVLRCFVLGWILIDRNWSILLFSQSFDFQDSKIVIRKCLTGCCYLHRKQSTIVNYDCFFKYDCLKNRLYCFISHYLMLNYVTKYSFFEFIQISPQIVDFTSSPIYGINKTVQCGRWASIFDVVLPPSTDSLYINQKHYTPYSRTCSTP